MAELPEPIFQDALIEPEDVGAPVLNFQTLHLSGPHSAAATTLTVGEVIPADWPQVCFVVLGDSEVVKSTAHVGSIFSGLTRQFDKPSSGGAAAVWPDGTTLQLNLIAFQYNQLLSDLRGVQEKVGLGDGTSGPYTGTFFKGTGEGISLWREMLAADIPVLTPFHIPNLSADKITSDVLNIARIPPIPFTNITGTLSQAQIPAITDATKIPNLPASKTTSGEFDPLRIPNLSANKITADVLALARIPTMDLAHLPAISPGNLAQTAWTAMPTPPQVTQNGINVAQTVEFARYQLIGKQVEIAFFIHIDGTGTPNQQIAVTMPAAFASYSGSLGGSIKGVMGTFVYLHSGFSNHFGNCIAEGATKMALQVHLSASTFGNNPAIAMGVNDNLSVRASYELA